jgi:hypothetical protein
MTKNPRCHTLLTRPSAISIHNDGDVPGNILQVRRGRFLHLTVIGFHLTRIERAGKNRF